jgi:hypothetical protein
MKRLKQALFITLLGCGIMSLHPGSAAAAVNNWQKSVIIQSQGPTDFSTSGFDQSVNNAVADGANYIVLVVHVHQSNIYSTDVGSGWDTPTDQSLANATSYIHGKGAHVVYSVHDDSNDGQWRAFINPGDRAGWFAAYGNELTHFAQVAQANGAEELVIGTEMTSMTSQNSNSSNAGYWQGMIQKVRSVYGGKLTYSAQHQGYMSDADSLGFWSQLDYIGLSAYYGLGTDQSVGAIEGQWGNYNNSNIKSLSDKYGKQVLFTEIGYVSKDNGLIDPGAAFNYGGGYNPTIQANAYQALFDYWNNYSYMAGAALWDWNSNPNFGGNGNIDYTPQNKPAEAIMKQWFTAGGGTNGGGGGVITPVTPPVTMPANFSASSTTSPVAVNTATTTTVIVKAATAGGGALVDLEIYNAGGQKVAQQSFENQTLNGNGTTFSTNWTPTAIGVYTIKVGVFTANWSSNVYWNNGVATLNVFQPGMGGGGTPTPTPTPVVTPTPTPTPVPTPTPTPTPVTPTTANITIWWPGGTVGGVQPFKALADGLANSQYNLYWQVDNGGLNKLDDNTNPIPHKEALVDLSGWNWNGNSQYTINFVAKDLGGNVLGQKTVVITVVH